MTKFPTKKRLLALSGLVASIGLVPNPLLAVDVELKADQTLLWTVGQDYLTTGVPAVPFLGDTLDVGGMLTKTNSDPLYMVIDIGDKPATLNLDSTSSTGLTFTHTSVDTTDGIPGITGSSSLGGATGELTINSTGGGPMNFSFNRTGIDVGSGGTDVYAISSEGGLTINSPDSPINVGANFVTARDDTQANASVDLIGIYSNKGDANLTGDLNITESIRQATGNSVASFEGPWASGHTMAVNANDGNATVIGDITISNVVQDVTSDTPTGYFTSPSNTGNIIGIRSELDSSLTGNIAILKVSRNNTTNTPSEFISSNGGVYGIWSDQNATTTGDISISDVKVQATALGAGSFPDIKMTIAGISTGASGGGDVTFDGNIKISEYHSTTTTNAAGYAQNGGGVYGILSSNDVTASGAIDISDIKYKVTDPGGAIQIAYSLHGISAGEDQYDDPNQSVAVMAKDMNVSLSGIDHEAEIGAAGDNSSNALLFGLTAAIMSEGTAEVGNISLMDFNSKAMNLGEGDAGAFGEITGMSVYKDASANEVILSNLTYSAETKGAGNYGISAGGYNAGIMSLAGKATATGDVLLSDITRTAISAGAGASANSGAAAAGGSAFNVNGVGGNYGVYGDLDVAATNVTLNNINNLSTVTGGEGGASAYGGTAGLFSFQGTATASGDVSITDITREATSVGGSVDAGDVDTFNVGSVGFENRIAGNYGIYANGNATGNNVTLANISHTATTGGDGASAIANAFTAGIYSATGVAKTIGNVTITGINTMAKATTSTADARLYTYGLYGATGVETSGNVMVEAISTATAGTSGKAWQLGQASGLMGGGTIKVTGGLMTPTLISAKGSEHAFAISTTPNPTGPTTTDITGLVNLSAEATSLDNKYTSYDRTTADSKAAVQQDARPVSEAEYLGMGAADTLNLTPRTDKISDNGGNALRIFGAETINMGAGTTVLNEGSWIVNQKAFDSTSTGADFGKITGTLRNTDLNITNGGTLVVAGNVLSGVTAAMGAHNNGLFSTGGQFALGTDYTLAANLATGSTMRVESTGAMSLSSLTQETESTLTFVFDKDASNQLFTGKIDVTGDATLAGNVNTMFDAGVGLLEELGTQTTVTVLTADILDTTGLDVETQTTLFYDYEYSKQDNDLVFDFTRNELAVDQAINTGGGSVNTSAGLNALINSESLAFMPQLADLINKLPAGSEKNLVKIANQLHGETGATASTMAANSHMNTTTLLDNSLTGNANAFTVAPSSGDDGMHNWAVKTAYVGSYGKQEATDDFFGYDVTDSTFLVAVERSLPNTTFGVLLALGRSEVDFDQFNNETTSDNYTFNLYGRHNWGTAFLIGRLGYGYSSIESTRNLPDFGLTAKSDPDANFFTAGLFGGYDFSTANGWTLTPTLGLSMVQSDTDAYKESGAGVYDIHYGASDINSLEIQANLGLSRQFSMLTSRLNVGLGYETGDTQNTVRTTFGGLPNTPGFDSLSSERSPLRFMGNIGVDWAIKQNMTVSLDYLTSLQDDYQSHGGQISLKISF